MMNNDTLKYSKLYSAVVSAGLKIEKAELSDLEFRLNDFEKKLAEYRDNVPREFQRASEDLIQECIQLYERRRIELE
jgi:hypothetical protein